MQNISYNLQFNKLCDTLKLGELLSEPETLTGGHMHKMFAMLTTTGKYAVKALNPIVMMGVLFYMENYAEIKTDRLYLRPFRLEDAEFASFNSKQPKVAAEMSDMVLETKEEAKGWIQETRTWFNVDDDICQILAIERLEDRKVIGLIGVAAKDNLGGEVEILYGVVDEEQNKGYATEAAKALVDWAFNNCITDYLVAIVKQRNIPSQRVIEKIGFEYIENREIMYEDNIVDFKYYKLCKDKVK